ncbi:Zinc/iron permease [Gigaspora margarita]|uniref:Zinc/iron permease n=1 Tax=Gigaspora margarita TaxID=4874 RepID=A0A8H4EQ32_GIGMA|nr:Zinc/iron permease [Gigaspora margarita]
MENENLPNLPDLTINDQNAIYYDEVRADKNDRIAFERMTLMEMALKGMKGKQFDVEGALYQNNTLTELNLSFNYIDSEGLKALARALCENVTLTSLDLSFNIIDNEGRTKNPRLRHPSTSIKLSVYLNLFADFTHNVTDGLAMAASFYTSPNIDATTTVLVFFHEIPHENRRLCYFDANWFHQTTSNVITVIGTFLRTFIEIMIEDIKAMVKNIVQLKYYHHPNVLGHEELVLL